MHEALNIKRSKRWRDATFAIQRHNKRKIVLLFEWGGQQQIEFSGNKTAVLSHQGGLAS